MSTFADHFRRLRPGGTVAVRMMERLLTPDANLEAMAARARGMTRQYFGKTMRLFAPLYLSNECVNVCKYCGFSRNNPILRVTLTPDQVEVEARHLYEEGFRSVLLVAGEHPKFVSERYLEECVRRVRPFMPAVALEVGPMEREEYEPLTAAGAEGLVVYQETYDRKVYTEMHTAGPKKNFDWRLETPERAYAAGFRRIGVGALLGLADWRWEAMCLAAHVEYLLKHCWKSAITVSFPRLRPAAGEFDPLVYVTDREFTQLLLAFRICFPQVGLVLSTREPVYLRDGLMGLGVTYMSAGSHTEPGGYTGQGREDLHRREKGKAVRVIASEGEYATEQFQISDERTVGEVAKKLEEAGLDPVWKDWDFGLGSASEAEVAASMS